MKGCINLKDPKDCCGCNACADVCGVGAISFAPDKEGFLYPLVDAAKCVNCGRCVRVCPVGGVDGLRAGSANRVQPEALAAISNDIGLRFDSTSGGLFSELALLTFANGGCVGGAVWGGDWQVMQVIADSVDDLPRLRSSKYAQSNALGFYRAVKQALHGGREVLVCGTPCQMVALRLYLGREYDNLTVVDFVCRGVNSPLVFRRYVEMFESAYGEKVVAVKQKSKELGWHRLTTKFAFESGRVAYDPRETSAFMRGYLETNAYSRPSCYACRFKGFPRLADITLADCWSASERLDGDFGADLGNSLVLCNTAKGTQAVATLGGRIQRREVNWESVLAGNPALVKPLQPPKVDRRRFFSLLQDNTLEVALAGSVVKVGKPTAFCGWWPRCVARIRRLWSLRGGMATSVGINGWTRVLGGRPLVLPRGRVVAKVAANARMRLDKDIRMGISHFWRSTHEECRLLLGANSVLEGGGFDISYGCDVEVFPGATLSLGHSGYANFGLTSICAKSIKIGKWVNIGRRVTIRDTNGRHYLNTPGYVCSEPVEIGDHVWLCEGCQILPGVKIGAGSVVAAGAVVTKDVPANVLVGGVPARVLRTDVRWR